ncbi:MAG TPA: hypothetical protein PKC98_25485, partial [Candidatus Melainabacteria bacterium]|nr:hypothetical protein [Candidatus Melainabacteria bacterium]
LRFFLMYSPRWLFLLPGALLILLGLLGYAVAMPGLTLFGATSSAPLACFLSGTFILGLIPGLSFMLFRQKKKAISKEKEIEWDKQDQKLGKEIESDKVKQLEAKIETLETALKSALAKRK